VDDTKILSEVLDEPSDIQIQLLSLFKACHNHVLRQRCTNDAWRALTLLLRSNWIIHNAVRYIHDYIEYIHLLGLVHSALCSIHELLSSNALDKTNIKNNGHSLIPLSDKVKLVNNHRLVV
jgi:hypothetical protein